MSTIQTMELRTLVKTHYGMDGNFTSLPAEWGGTYRLTLPDGKRYLVKYVPPHVHRDRVDLESAALQYLHANRLGIATPSLVRSNSGEFIVDLDGSYLRIMHWIDGRLWHNVNPRTADLATSLGKALGELKASLRDFSHATAHFSFKWAPHEVEWIADELDLFDTHRREIIMHLLHGVRDVLPLVQTLPRTVNYNDANDHNIIVSDDRMEPRVVGFIDFGDLQHGPAINDLAICLAYAMQRCPDPLTLGKHIVGAYHAVCPLSEDEIRVLFPLTIARLLISVTFSARRRKEDPDNAYWQVSDEPAWDLLDILSRTPEHLALVTFRETCEMEPSPYAERLKHWLSAHGELIHPVTGSVLQHSELEVFDWSVGSSVIHPENAVGVKEESDALFTRLARQGLRAGIGRYNEPRMVYTAGHYAKEGLNGPERRTIHLGIDVFMPAGTPLYAPLEGTVIANCADPGDRGYGYLLILEHRAEEMTFYTLYGHNAQRTLDWLNPGDLVAKGARIAEIGDSDENGGWIPHLHFQLITNLLDYENDFPGVANPLHRDVWLSLCPDPNLILKIDHPSLVYKPASLNQLAKRRSSVLAPNISLAPGPLHIVRGWKASLYESDGRPFLDTCNNIAHVGHEHPAVVQAAQRQARVLNTNTRYLHKEVIALAEELLETLPPRLSHVYFVNSGSEANDLALRIARTYVGRKKTLVLDQSYHGITQACLDVSPYKFKGKGGFTPPDDIELLPLPDTYRHYPEGDEACIGEATEFLTTYLNDGPVTFIHETLPSCAGQIVPPRAYFEKVYEAIRAQGGVCIADEVQTGLGRIGSHYWAFRLYGVEPDIVTIGKPLGNGHPVAAVAITRDLAETFDNGMEFFSSFGGNPVSCATARAVMQVIRDEHLKEHALTVGSYWKEALERIAEDCSYIGDVRGFGLFLGIEFSQPGSRDPAPQQATYVQRRMLEHGILTSLDGPDRNVMKIKPPNCITREEVGYFLAVFSKTCAEDALASLTSDA